MAMLTVNSSHLQRYLEALLNKRHHLSIVAGCSSQGYDVFFVKGVSTFQIVLALVVQSIL
eukprot:4574407-Amphidinium_carterae.1